MSLDRFPKGSSQGGGHLAGASCVPARSPHTRPFLTILLGPGKDLLTSDAVSGPGERQHLDAVVGILFQPVQLQRRLRGGDVFNLAQLWRTRRHDRLPWLWARVLDVQPWATCPHVSHPETTRRDRTAFPLGKGRSHHTAVERGGTPVWKQTRSPQGTRCTPSTGTVAVCPARASAAADHTCPHTPSLGAEDQISTLRGHISDGALRSF